PQQTMHTLLYIGLGERYSRRMTNDESDHSSFVIRHSSFVIRRTKAQYQVARPGVGDHVAPGLSAAVLDRHRRFVAVTAQRAAQLTLRHWAASMPIQSQMRLWAGR